MLLESISLTPSPARIFPQRVSFLEGRLDHREAAKRWRSKLDRAEYELLRRAAFARYERRKGDPIADRRAREAAGDEARSQRRLDRPARRASARVPFASRRRLRRAPAGADSDEALRAGS
jgi:hypothetical protein